MSSPVRSASPSRRPPAAEETGPSSVSDDLAAWARQSGPRTIGSLIDAFGQKSFAVLFVVLLALPALPIPTGGLSHLFEAVAMLLAVELVVGRTEVWIPRRWETKVIKGVTSPKFANVLIMRIRRMERFTRPRLASLLERPTTARLFGAGVFAFSLTAFVAPPFSGLDTLPALGVVVMSLGILFGDVVILLAGTATGAAGVGLVVGLGSMVLQLL